MKRLLLIGAIAGAALWLGAAPAVANPAGDDDEPTQIAKKKRDGGSRDEEREED